MTQFMSNDRNNKTADKYSCNQKKSTAESCSTCSLTTSSSSSSSLSKDVLKETKLNVILTKKGLQIYGTWSKEKLLNLLTDRLKQCTHIQANALEKISYNVINDRRLWITIYSGLYSTCVLKKLQEKGMSIYNIIKAMKLGLISLSYCELLYFKDFNVEPYILEFKGIWSSKFSNELILNLRPTGLSEIECWNIIVHGVMLQSPSILRHLILSGIDVPGILNWKSPVNFASSKIIEFLRHIDIEENIIKLVEYYGIDEETEQMLVDLGLNEMEEKIPNIQEVICECSLTILEAGSSSSKVTENICKVDSSKSGSSFTDTSNDLQLCSCQCYQLAKNKTEDEVIAERNDYLRQNVMIPLTWVIARTLEYKPTEPIHFMAYQLLHWTRDNVHQTKKDNLQQLIALATIAMDRKFIVKKRLEEEKQIENLNKTAMENIPCCYCKDRQELRRIKERCWKCVIRPLRKFESCEFPHICSSCKINVSDMSDDHSTLPRLEPANNEHEH
ncbi:hypothetical protein ANTQUA_LOCUS3602 [Anthophora quadrimaculata]